jgi:hypothetical protein
LLPTPTPHKRVPASLLFFQTIQQVDVRSSWKQQQPPTASKAVATDPQQRSEAEVQTTDRTDAAVQATSGPHGASSKARVDAASLSSFLDHAGSSMLSELAANVDYAAGRSRHTRKAGSEVGTLQQQLCRLHYAAAFVRAVGLFDLQGMMLQCYSHVMLHCVASAASAITTYLT